MATTTARPWQEARPAAGDRWRYEDLLQFPDDDGLRREVVDGALVVSPSPSPRHQEVVLEIAVALRAALPPGRRVYAGPVDLPSPDGDTLVPDVLVVSAEGVGDRAVLGVPDLVVEVLSSSNRRHDLVTKRHMYAERGVRRYWVVDPWEPWLLELGLDSDPVTEVRHDGRGPHRLSLPFPVVVEL